MKTKIRRKVLIVDDRLDEAVRNAGLLAELPPELLAGTELIIELTNNACFAAEQIIASPPGELRWDIVIADVHMPPADLADQPGVPTASVVIQKTPPDSQGREWTVHRCQPHTLTPDPRNGGVYLVDRLRDWSPVDGGRRPKVVLISRPLRGADRSHVDELVATHHDWLDYIDKDRWEGDKSGGDRRLLNGDEFVWALLDSIRKIDSDLWGRQLWTASVPDQVVLSTSLRQAVIAGHQYIHANFQTILILGEEGSGRSALAYSLHGEVRQRYPDAPTQPVVVNDNKLSGTGEAFGRVFADHVARAAGGTLVFDDLDRLPRHQQASVSDLLDRGYFQRSPAEAEERCQARLIIGVMRRRSTLDALATAGQLDGRLLALCGHAVLEVPALRELEEDAFNALIDLALKKANHRAGITPGARAQLRARPWPRNIRDLIGFVQMRAAASPLRKLTETDVTEEVRLRTVPLSGRPVGPLALYQYDLADDCVVAGAIRCHLKPALAAVVRELLNKSGGSLRSRLTMQEVGEIYGAEQLRHAGAKKPALTVRARQLFDADPTSYLQSRANQWREKLKKRLKAQGIDPDRFFRFYDGGYELVRSGWNLSQPTLHGSSVFTIPVDEIDDVA